ncbi:MAG: Guanosine-3',5'-bis(diphosphate) 3'-pyrophosphohydrolase [bacterium ADurb.Bin212]|nr:MAG: Guanosine-3',5'-bis(diphosphate) 3'-pyrophosphohydrolase [bacterium ADurb.Bin212]
MHKISHDFLSSIEKYSKDEQNIILKAYQFALDQHEGQIRKSGDPYFLHPLCVANEISKRKFDYGSISAALLHDTLEDCDVSYYDLSNNFGADIANLVDGVSKLSKIPIKNKPLFFSQQDYYNERVDNYRKLLVSSATDLRVLIIKLFDRLHNIQTLQHIKEDKRRYYALESIDIYAQIAERIGLSEVKGLLEDAAFPYAYPEEYMQTLKILPEINKEFIPKTIQVVSELLKSYSIEPIEIYGRTKHLYSIHNKLKEKYEFQMEKFFDLYGIRIILKDVEDCYKALGILHTIYKPIPGRIYDMIANPKHNGYQSLHTTLQDEKGEIFEAQIRTPQMHIHAEFGAAAHWHYKNTGDRNTALTKSQREWIGEIQKASRLNNNRDFLNFIQSDLFATKIFAFTPHGDIINLIKGSTVLDFAFRVHSKVGLKCAGAKINGEIASLDSSLNNGDTVEIITSSKAKPNINWLRMCKTSHAKQKIKRFLKEQNFNELAERGKKIFSELVVENSLTPISDNQARNLLSKSRLPYKSIDDLMVAVYNRSVSKYAALKTLYPEVNIQPSKKSKNLLKTDNSQTFSALRLKMAKCCNPGKTDKIVGYVGRDHTIKVHKHNCKFLKNTDPKRHIYIDPFDMPHSIS